MPSRIEIFKDIIRKHFPNSDIENLIEGIYPCELDTEYFYNHCICWANRMHPAYIFCKGCIDDYWYGRAENGFGEQYRERYGRKEKKNEDS